MYMFVCTYIWCMSKCIQISKILEKSNNLRSVYFYKMKFCIELLLYLNVIYLIIWKTMVL
jgi:hypothetical protein